MDLAFTPQEEAFRLEVRTFIADHLPAAIREKMAADRPLSKSELQSWQRVLNARGWATPSWPTEYGGPGWSLTQKYIFMNELHQAPAPEPLSFNVSMIGPVLIAFGSAWQKARFLSRAASLEEWWCQGFSEPAAGSDLAALKTTARRDGDHYIVSGQKIWQGMAHYADWGFFLVRTDPDAVKPQAGISMLLIDMTSPGVSVRPIVTLDGRHEVNSVFLDDVRVPVENCVGEENNGWAYTKYLLSNERTGIARVGMTKRLLARARRLAQEGGLINDPGFRLKLIQAEIDLRTVEITQLRILAEQTGANAPDPRSSILKIKGVEARQVASELLLEAAGPYAVPFVDVEAGVFPVVETKAWAATPAYLGLRAASIYGGSNEVQRNILAQTMLGLSKG